MNHGATDGVGIFCSKGGGGFFVDFWRVVNNSACRRLCFCRLFARANVSCARKRPFKIAIFEYIPLFFPLLGSKAQRIHKVEG